MSNDSLLKVTDRSVQERLEGGLRRLDALIAADPRDNDNRVDRPGKCQVRIRSASGIFVQMLVQELRRTGTPFERSVGGFGYWLHILEGHESSGCRDFNSLAEAHHKRMRFEFINDRATVTTVISRVRLSRLDSSSPNSLSATIAHETTTSWDEYDGRRQKAESNTSSHFIVSTLEQLGEVIDQFFDLVSKA